MKVQLNLNIHIVLIMFVVTGCFSGNKPIRYAHVPDNIKGIWVSDTTRITVRTSPRFMKFEFHQDREVRVCGLCHPGSLTCSGANIVLNHGVWRCV